MTSKKNNPFLIDVRWAAGKSPGASRDFDFKFPSLHFDPELDIRNLTGKVTATVTEDGVMLTGDLTFQTELDCTRCLETSTQELKFSFIETFVSSRAKLEESNERDEVHLLPPDGYIDVETLFREYALLELPARYLCSSECEGLCPVCGANLNEEDCGHKQDKIDPRLAVLGELLEEE